MALEDSEQKQNLLHSVYLELEELAPVFETDPVMQQLNEIGEQVATLQHEIAEILPQIQHVAHVSLLSKCLLSVFHHVLRNTAYVAWTEKEICLWLWVCQVRTLITKGLVYN